MCSSYDSDIIEPCPRIEIQMRTTLELNALGFNSITEFCHIFYPRVLKFPLPKSSFNEILVVLDNQISEPIIRTRQEKREHQTRFRHVEHTKKQAGNKVKTTNQQMKRVTFRKTTFPGGRYRSHRR